MNNYFNNRLKGMNKMLVFQNSATLMLAAIFMVSTAQASGLPDFTELVEKYDDAVVNISTTQKIKHSRTRVLPHQMPDQIPEGPFGDLFKHFFSNPGDRGGAPGAARHSPRSEHADKGLASISRRAEDARAMGRPRAWK